MISKELLSELKKNVNSEVDSFKLDKSKFKVGDWVVPLFDIPSTDYIYYANKPMKFFISQTWKDKDINKFFKYWKPKIGEWCWMWDKDWYNIDEYDIPKLTQFRYMQNSKYSDGNTLYEYCEPFIGELPTK